MILLEQPTYQDFVDENKIERVNRTEQKPRDLNQISWHLLGDWLVGGYELRYITCQPSVLTPFNNAPLNNAERKRQQLQKDRHAIYELCKKGDKGYLYTHISPLANSPDPFKCSSPFLMENIDPYVREGGIYVDTHQNSSQHTSPTTRKLPNAVNKRNVVPSRKAKAETKVTTRQTEESHKRDETVSQIIQLEQELGGVQPTLLDLLCRFSKSELDAVWDQIIWLYPDLCRKKTETPSEQMEIVQVVA